MNKIKEILNALILLGFPSKCVHCGWYDDFLCTECFSRIEFLKFQYCPACKEPSTGGYANHGCRRRTFIHQLVSLCWYRGPIVSLIHRLKFPPYLKATLSVITNLIQVALDPEDYLNWKGSIIVPVPLHPNRLRERGYNQAELIAQSLCKMIPGSEIVNLLIKPKENSAQSLILHNNNKRRTNVQGCYQINPQFLNLSSQKKIVLVDDVTTSGSTLDECAKIIKLRFPDIEIIAVTVAKG